MTRLADKEELRAAEYQWAVTMDRIAGQPEILAGLRPASRHLIALQRTVGKRAAVKWLGPSRRRRGGQE